MIGTVTKMDALDSLAPTSKWSITGDVITWYSGTDPAQPSDADIAAEVTRLQAVYDNKEYQRTRAVAYPKIGDQLDSLYHDILNNKLDKTGTWFTGITDVKNTTTLDEILLDGTDGSSINAGDKVLLG